VENGDLFVLELLITLNWLEEVVWGYHPKEYLTVSSINIVSICGT
jgi:hypothetical protein